MPETIHVFLDTLRERHGSIAGQLAHAGIEPAIADALRDRLLV